MTQRVRRAFAEGGSISDRKTAKLGEAEVGCDLGHGWRVAARRCEYPACLEQAQRAQVTIRRGAVDRAECPQQRTRADTDRMADFGDADRFFHAPACHAQGLVDNSLILPRLPC